MARIDVPMPQMGESIAEGTVSKWLKKVGDEVQRDEPLLEISTDKVDAEIPAPAAGILADLAVQEGETVEVGTILAHIETDRAAVGAPAAKAPEQVAAAAPAPEPAAQPAPEQPAPRPRPAAQPAQPAQPAPAAAPAAQPAPGAAPAPGEPEAAEERLRRRSSPLVRRIAAEHGVDIAEVAGTGTAGRVTKQDILAHLEGRETMARPNGGRAAPAAPATPARPPVAAPAGGFGADQLWDVFYGRVRHPEWPVRENDRLEPMDRIRRLTADHMVLAKRVAAHVHSFIEIDFTRVDRIRRANRARWESQGAKVSYTAFVAWAAARVLAEFPRVNATISGENILYRGAINIGIAVDLDPGLIVPVIRDAGDLNLLGIARRINDLAGRARDRKLKPDEIQGATFSITNPGVLGTLVGMPIIPEGTAAILGTGAIEKRPVVVEVDGVDSIAIRLRSFFSLGYDHRIVDGADAARFLARLKEVLESFPEEVS